MTPDDLVEEENCVCVPNDVSMAVLPSSVTLDVLLVEQNSFALERSVGDPVHPVVGSLKRCDAVLQSCLELNAKVTIGSKVFVTSPIQRAGFDAKSRRLWHPGEGKLLERGGQCVVVVLFLLTLAGLRGICRCQARMRQLETTGTGLEAGARSVLVEAWVLQPTVQATLGRHGGDPKSQGQLYFGAVMWDQPFCGTSRSVGPAVLWDQPFCGTSRYVGPAVMWDQPFCGTSRYVGPAVMLDQPFCGTSRYVGPAVMLDQPFCGTSRSVGPAVMWD
uniref:Uncharacterized protein n=1 Tax=Knipowitschia caucasica TaxID=637954 RepID=A0AAV2MMA5_KNICA